MNIQKIINEKAEEKNLRKSTETVTEDELDQVVNQTLSYLKEVYEKGYKANIYYKEVEKGNSPPAVEEFDEYPNIHAYMKYGLGLDVKVRWDEDATDAYNPIKVTKTTWPPLLFLAAAAAAFIVFVI